jgi:hypothetical protein
MKMKKTILSLAVLLAMTGCSDRPQPQVVQQQPQVIQQQPQVVAGQPAPVIINQAPAQNHTGDLIAAGAVGYMMGKATSQPTYAAPQPTTVVRETVVKQAAPAAPVAAPTKAPAEPSTYAYKPTSPVAPSKPATVSVSKPMTSSSSYKPSSPSRR